MDTVKGNSGNSCLKTYLLFYKFLYNYPLVELFYNNSHFPNTSFIFEETEKCPFERSRELFIVLQTFSPLLSRFHLQYSKNKYRWKDWKH